MIFLFKMLVTFLLQKPKLPGTYEVFFILIFSYIIKSISNTGNIILKIIGWCDVKPIMTLPIKKIMSILKV
jgi:hypothetical protein